MGEGATATKEGVGKHVLRQGRHSPFQVLDASAILRQGRGARGSGTQKFVYQKFSFVNFIFFHHEIWVQRGVPPLLLWLSAVLIHPWEWSGNQCGDGYTPFHWPVLQRSQPQATSKDASQTKLLLCAAPPSVRALAPHTLHLPFGVRTMAVIKLSVKSLNTVTSLPVRASQIVTLRPEAVRILLKARLYKAIVTG